MSSPTLMLESPPRAVLFTWQICLPCSRMHAIMVYPGSPLSILALTRILGCAFYALDRFVDKERKQATYS
eukprot:8797266-Alexandrium_andersonii.AAC.1